MATSRCPALQSITAGVPYPLPTGKTTLLRLIAGLEEPTAGRVLFDGEDVTDYEVQDRDLGFVFQVGECGATDGVQLVGD